MRDTHFNTRCRERGITSTDVDQLFRGLQWAIEQGRDDICQFVMTFRRTRYWRFRCPDGIYYALTGLDDPNPRTVITPEMMRKKKWAKKQAKKGRTRN